ncbi:MAG: CPBP family intramembrane metalloprotease [Oscillospiraceae bacterium]|nr:CPBP family intramembrane metalloprotease [Oscillospiraceae bacterium]
MKHDLHLSDTAPVFARIRREPGQHVPKGLLILVLIFALITLLDAAWQSILAFLISFSMCSFMPADRAKHFFDAPSRSVLLMLFLTAVSITLTFLYCRLIERRSARSLGITKQHFLPDYLLGFFIGTGMMAASVFLALAGGAVRFCGISKQIPGGMILLFLAGWIIQGFSEELTFRSFLMMSAGTYHTPVTSVFVSSLLFAAAHLANDGISIPAFLNLFLFGVLTALIFLRTDSIWCGAALHSFWNMAQSNFFGLKVSGLDIGASILSFEQTDGKALLNGGGFGLEGAVGTTAVLLAAISLVFLMKQRIPQDPAIQYAEKGEVI